MLLLSNADDLDFKVTAKQLRLQINSEEQNIALERIAPDSGGDNNDDTPSSCFSFSGVAPTNARTAYHITVEVEVHVHLRI